MDVLSNFRIFTLNILQTTPQYYNEVKQNKRGNAFYIVLSRFRKLHEIGDTTQKLLTVKQVFNIQFIDYLCL